VSVDQVAKYLVTEDSTVMIYDLRTPEEYKHMNIPGSVNIPYSDLLNDENDLSLSDRNIKKIFYSNGDFESNYAYTIARGLNNRNVYVMKGGMNEWFNTVMNSSFTGDRISARENALFETRFRARKIFTDINSLPDSLKVKYFEARHIAATKLDGGCE
jgi:rhodanese-related sulfurtransferase